MEFLRGGKSQGFKEFERAPDSGIANFRINLSCSFIQLIDSQVFLGLGKCGKDGIPASAAFLASKMFAIYFMDRHKY